MIDTNEIKTYKESFGLVNFKNMSLKIGLVNFENIFAIIIRSTEKNSQIFWVKVLVDISTV